MATQSQQSQRWSQLCLDAVKTTTECADWCIHNDAGRYEQCIRTCLDAGTLATAAGRIVWREGPHTQQLLGATAEILEACAKDCQEHSGAHDVMDRCADACREAAEACRAVADRQTDTQQSQARR